MTPAFRRLLFCAVMLATHAFAATDVRVNFTLNTTDENGAPLAENRSYFG